MLDYEGYIELSVDFDAIAAAAGSFASDVLSGVLGTKRLDKLDPGFTAEVNEVVENINARKAAKSY